MTKSQRRDYNAELFALAETIVSEIHNAECRMSDDSVLYVVLRHVMTAHEIGIDHAIGMTPEQRMEYALGVTIRKNSVK